MPLLSNFYDDFVGSNGTGLTSHTTDSGDSWTQAAGSLTLDGSGNCKTTSTTAVQARASDTTPGSNPYVELEFMRPNTAAGIWEAGFGTREAGAVFQEGYHLVVVRFTTTAGVTIRSYEGDLAAPTVTDVTTIEAGPLAVNAVTSIPRPCVMHWEGTTLTVNGIDYTVPYALRSGEYFVLRELSNSGGDPMKVSYIDGGSVTLTSEEAGSTEPLSFGTPAVVAAIPSLEPLAFGEPTISLTGARVRSGIKATSMGKPVGPNNATRAVRKGIAAVSFGTPTAFPPA